jgi:M6 family metalloprotease-like protein
MSQVTRWALRIIAAIAGLWLVRRLVGLGRWRPPWRWFEPAAEPAPLPLGPHAATFYGSTRPQNTFDNPPGGGGGGGGGGGPGGGATTLQVLAVLVDTRDYRSTNTPAALTTYRDAKLNVLNGNVGPFWNENSFGAVGANVTMRDEMLPLVGAFDDYFNRDYIAASLTGVGLASAGWPLVLDGTASVTLHVHDAHDRNIDVQLAPTGTFADAAALAAACQTTIDAVMGVPGDWLNCSASADQLRFELVLPEVAEGSFIRVKSGANNAALGLEGPEEAPGSSSSVAFLRGKPVPAGFPVTLAGTEQVLLEVRDKDYRTRRFTVALPAGPVATPSALAALLVPTLNTEFNWVESYDAGPERLGLRLKASFSDARAAIRVVGGTGLSALGLDGPMRVDGVVSFDGRLTVRGDWQATVAQALSLHLARRAGEMGIAVTAANQSQLDDLVDADLCTFQSFLVLFIEQGTAIPSRRAGASSLGYFDLSVPGMGGYTYQRQIAAGYMIGTGAEGWETWAHELGHVLGLWDLYAHDTDDDHFDTTFDYVREWEVMDSHWAAAHAGAWHKLNRGWIAVEDVDPPAAGATETHRFTLAPLEYPATDYAGAGSTAYPVAHALRIRISANHWIMVENRQPAQFYSQSLPDDTVGSYPPDPAGSPGGVFVTDAVSPWAPPLYRSIVTALNPHGAGISRGMKQGDSLDLSTTYPAYDGIVVRVVDTVPGPAGKPESLRVEVEWGPGDFLELAIRNWAAPAVYGTHDVWIDWPGNGQEDYSAGDPPLGNGDATHWHPAGSVVNHIRVRVHNNGTIAAEDVVVRAFTNQPMGMGDRGSFVPLADSPPQDIPPGAFGDFAFEWRPTLAGHTCIRAEVLTHASALGDLDVGNNAAQENVSDFFPTAGSPYEPVEFTFTIRSDYDRPLDVSLLPTGLVDGMDLEVERRQLTLAPNAEVLLRGRLFLDEAKISPDPRKREKPLAFHLHAFRATADSLLPFGGISVNVHPGYRAELRFWKIEPDRKEGRVVRVLGSLEGKFASHQRVDAALVGADGETYGGTTLTDGDGEFAIPLAGVPSGDGELMLYYFGEAMAACHLGPEAVLVP